MRNSSVSLPQVYKASRPGIPLRVYFLIYAGSVEEQVVIQKLFFSVFVKLTLQGETCFLNHYFRNT